MPTPPSRRLITALKTARTEAPDAWLSSIVEELRDPTRDDDVAAMLVARDAITR